MGGKRKVLSLECKSKGVIDGENEASVMET